MAELSRSSIASGLDGQSVCAEQTRRKRLDRERRLRKNSVSLSEANNLRGHQTSPASSSSRVSTKNVRHMGLREQQEHMAGLAKDNFGIKLNYDLECKLNSKLRDQIENFEKELSAVNKKLARIQGELLEANKEKEKLRTRNVKLHEALELQDSVINDAQIVNLSFQERLRDFTKEHEEQSYYRRQDNPNESRDGGFSETMEEPRVVEQLERTISPTSQMIARWPRIADDLGNDGNNDEKNSENDDEDDDYEDNDESSSDSDSENDSNSNLDDDIALPELSDDDMMSLYQDIHNDSREAIPKPNEPAASIRIQTPRRSVEEFIENAHNALSSLLRAECMLDGQGLDERYEEEAKSNPDTGSAVEPTPLLEEDTEGTVEEATEDATPESRPPTPYEEDLFADCHELPTIFLANRRLGISPDLTPRPVTPDEPFELVSPPVTPKSLESASDSDSDFDSGCFFAEEKDDWVPISPPLSPDSKLQPVEKKIQPAEKKLPRAGHTRKKSCVACEARKTKGEK
ncbi:hypothetical protein EDC01DRAFT_732396 [Geopyxis carbonaria]|nr:hypothetical protein EDC01DRAFT_732396 [Geopyxis carbonaria]